MIQIDMPMPKSCEECRLLGYDTGYAQVWCAAEEDGEHYHDSSTICDKLYARCPLREVKTGYWIKIGRWGRHFECSNCKNTLDFSGVNAGRGDANFCPNCGSRNEVKNNGND